MFPLLLEKSLQAKFLVPMAVSLGFGVLFATLITLIFLPAIYVILEDLKGVAFRAVGRNRREIVESGAGPVPGATPQE